MVLAGDLVPAGTTLVTSGIEHERLCEIDTTSIINKIAMAKSRKCNLNAVDWLPLTINFDIYTETPLSLFRGGDPQSQEISGGGSGPQTLYNIKNFWTWTCLFQT